MGTDYDGKCHGQRTANPPRRESEQQGNINEKRLTNSHLCQALHNVVCCMIMWLRAD